MDEKTSPPRPGRPFPRAVTIGAAVIAALLAATTGMSLYIATHQRPPRPVLLDRGFAGWDGHCASGFQVAVDFATDAAMHHHKVQLRAHPDVVDADEATQSENTIRHRALLAALAAGPDGYEEMVAEADHLATLWLLLAGGTDYRQFADVLRAQLGGAAQAVRVDQPCLTVGEVSNQVSKLRDYPTRCLMPAEARPAGPHLPTGCPPIP